MQQDEFSGCGGSYTVDAGGKRVQVEKPTVGGVRCLHPDVLAAEAARQAMQELVAQSAADVIAAIPALGSAELAHLAELERAGKQRVTVLDAIAAAQVNY